MHFSNEPIDVMEIIILLLPVVTFAMGYVLTGISHKREQKLGIIREKFEKLYHPFYMMIPELGEATEEGFAFSVGDGSVLQRFFDHLAANVYLATAEGQKLFWEARRLFISCMAEGGTLSKENEQRIDAAIGALFAHFLQEYARLANALGYDLGGSEAFIAIRKDQ